MSTAAFDTLSAAQDLEAAGIERHHAEAIAKAINHGDERAATKADLDLAVERLRSDLRSDMVKLAIAFVLANAAIAGALFAGIIRLLSSA